MKHTKCKYCFEHKLVWQRIGEGWRLFTLDGRLHICLPLLEIRKATMRRKYVEQQLPLFSHERYM